jgi:hypothetical protein
MHKFIGTDNGVRRACFQTFCAADAGRLIDDGNTMREMLAAGNIKRNDWPGQQLCQRGNTFLATGRAAIYRRMLSGNRLRVRHAADVAALGALRLRQEGVDSVDQGGVHGAEHSTSEVLLDNATLAFAGMTGSLGDDNFLQLKLKAGQGVSGETD